MKLDFSERLLIAALIACVFLIANIIADERALNEAQKPGYSWELR